MVGEVQLEARHAGQGAGGSADLRGEVRQGRQVVAELCGHVREARPRELHPIARVAREADGHGGEGADGLRRHAGVPIVRRGSSCAASDCRSVVAMEGRFRAGSSRASLRRSSGHHRRDHRSAGCRTRSAHVDTVGRRHP